MSARPFKALVLRSPWGPLIADGHKTVETRTWETSYRGPLLIVLGKGIDRAATSRFIDGGPRLSRRYPQGHAVAIANLYACVQMAEEHEKAALVKARPGLFAWCLSAVQPIEPFPVKGRLGLFDSPRPLSSIALYSQAFPPEMVEA
jgi:hypothetical protein